MAELHSFTPPCNFRTKLVPTAAPPLQMGWRPDTQAWIQQPHTWKPLHTSLGAKLKKLGKLGRVGCLLVIKDTGGDPAFESLGSKLPLLEHLALGEGKATELELLASHMIHNKNEHVQKKACNKQASRKGIKQEDPRGELDNQHAQQQPAYTNKRTKTRRKTA